MCDIKKIKYFLSQPIFFLNLIYIIVFNTSMCQNDKFVFGIADAGGNLLWIYEF